MLRGQAAARRALAQHLRVYPPAQKQQLQRRVGEAGAADFPQSFGEGTTPWGDAPHRHIHIHLAAPSWRILLWQDSQRWLLATLSSKCGQEAAAGPLDAATSSTSAAGTSPFGYEMLNRNARQPKKANHGKRPCNSVGRKKRNGGKRR